MVIEKTVSNNGLSFQTYEVWEAERWNYSKCRYDLKCMMRFCERAHISYTGALVNPDQRQRLFSGDELACNILKRPTTTWHPDMLLWNDERNLNATNYRPSRNATQNPAHRRLRLPSGRVLGLIGKCFAEAKLFSKIRIER